MNQSEIELSAVIEAETTDIRPSYPGEFLEEFLTEDETPMAIIKSQKIDIPHFIAD